VRARARVLPFPPQIRSINAMHTVKPAQRRTLEVGSCLVLGGLGFGFQFGGWPVWTFFAGIGLYAAWVLVYAEITVQASRHPAIWTGILWSDRRRSRGAASEREFASHAPNGGASARIG
jgi:hypothetical protein